MQLNKALVTAGVVGGLVALGVLSLSRLPMVGPGEPAHPDAPPRDVSRSQQSTPSARAITNSIVNQGGTGDSRVRLEAEQLHATREEAGQDVGYEPRLISRGQRTPESWRELLTAGHRRLESERESGGPGVFLEAYAVDQTSILAILDLSGRYELIPEGEGIHLNHAPAGEHWLGSGNALYRVVDSEFPGFVELSRLAYRPPVDPDPSVLAQASTQVDERYAQAMALLAKYLPE